MITGPTVAPIGDLSNSAGPTAGTISVELEEMPAIADGLDAVEGAVTMVDQKTGELEPTYTIALNDEDMNKDNPFMM